MHQSRIQLPLIITLLVALSCGEPHTPADPPLEDDGSAGLGNNPPYINFCERYSDEGIDGTIDETTTHTYDAQGRLISAHTVNTARGLDSLTSYTYDAQGRLIKGLKTITQPREDTLGESTQKHGLEYQFNAKGQPIACTTWSAVDVPSTPIKEEYSYNDDGTLNTITYTNSTILQHTKKYEDQRIITLGTHTNIPPTETQHTFDVNGRLVDIDLIHYDTRIARQHIEWSSTGNISKAQNLKKLTTYTYNDDNIAIKKETVNIYTDDLLSSLEIQYDKDNNVSQATLDRRTIYQVSRAKDTIRLFSPSLKTTTDVYNFNGDGTLREHIETKATLGSEQKTQTKHTYSYECFEGRAAPKPLPKFEYNELRLSQEDYKQPQCQLNNASHEAVIPNIATLGWMNRLHQFKAQLDL